MALFVNIFKLEIESQIFVERTEYSKSKFQLLKNEGYNIYRLGNYIYIFKQETGNNKSYYDIELENYALKLPEDYKIYAYQIKKAIRLVLEKQDEFEIINSYYLTLKSKTKKLLFDELYERDVYTLQIHYYKENFYLSINYYREFSFKNKNIYANSSNIKEYLSHNNQLDIYYKLFPLRKNDKIDFLKNRIKKLRYIYKKILELIPTGIIKEVKYDLENFQQKELEIKKLKYYDGPEEQKSLKYRPISFDQPLKIVVLGKKDYLEVYEKTLKRGLNNKIKRLEIFSFNNNIEKYTLLEQLQKLNPDIVLYDSSQYLDFKTFFITENYISQAFKPSTLKNNYALANLILNIFGKCGLTYWELEKTNINTPTFIIGIGASGTTDNRLLGILQIFNTEGEILQQKNFLGSNLNDYKKIFFQNLSNIIQRFKLNNKNINLIFHIYKIPGKHTEIKQLNNFLKNFLKEYDYTVNFKYAYLRVSRHNNFIYRFQSNEKKIQLTDQPYLFQLNKKQGLLLYPTKKLLTDKPLLIEIFENTTEYTLLDFTQQIIDLINVSYQSIYNLASEPITISYPKKLVKLLIKIFQKDPSLKDKKYKFLTEDVTNKLWFL